MSEEKRSTHAVAPPHVPTLPAAFIPLIDTLLPRSKGYVPHRLSAKKLWKLRADLVWVAEEFGYGSPVYNRALLVTALEYARAEMLP